MKNRSLWFTLTLLCTISGLAFALPAPNVEHKNLTASIDSLYNTLIKGEAAGDIKIGMKLDEIAELDGYKIAVEKKIYEPIEENAVEILYWVVRGSDTLMEIFPGYDFENEQYGDQVELIYVKSKDFQTAEKIGVGITITDFKTTFPDANIFYTIYGQYYIATSTHGNMQFIVDPTGTSSKPRGKSETIPMSFTDFSADTKIIGISIE
jgi:hypothetical protein